MSQPWLPDLKFPTLLVLPELPERRVRNNPRNMNHIEHLRWRLLFFVFVHRLCNNSAGSECYAPFCPAGGSRQRKTFLLLCRAWNGNVMYWSWAEEALWAKSRRILVMFQAKKSLCWFLPHQCEVFPLLCWTVKRKGWLWLPRAPNAPEHPSNHSVGFLVCV